MSTELILERTVPVAPAIVWKAWTDPDLLMQWFCPVPWKTVECDIDLRPGGAFRTVMVGPDGERFENIGCFLEVDAPHRLVWTTALAPGYGPAPEPGGPPVFTAVLTFDSVEGGTHYTARALHRDVDAAKAHHDMGFHDGWGKALTQLVDAAKGHVAES